MRFVDTGMWNAIKHIVISDKVYENNESSIFSNNTKCFQLQGVSRKFPLLIIIVILQMMNNLRR